MSQYFQSIRSVFVKHPILNGIVSYAVIWPTGSLIQQTIAGTEKYDFKKAMRFSIYGSLVVAPTLYGWIKLTTAMWPKTNLKSGISKALTEQLSYGPFASVLFFYSMSLMERKTPKEALNEVVEKFPQTWKMGVCFWPMYQTINFTFIPERNRVAFVSLGSLFWTVFLAYMKQLESSNERDIRISQTDQNDFQITKTDIK